MYAARDRGYELLEPTDWIQPEVSGTLIQEKSENLGKWDWREQAYGECGVTENASARTLGTQSG